MKIKSSILIITLTVVALASSTTSAFAVARAEFPNNSSLQAMPKNVKPNISGNINSTSTYESSYEYISDLPEAINPNKEETRVINQEQLPDDKNNLPLWASIISVLIILLGIAWGYSRLYPSRSK